MRRFLAMALLAGAMGCSDGTAPNIQADAATVMRDGPTTVDAAGSGVHATCSTYSETNGNTTITVGYLLVDVGDPATFPHFRVVLCDPQPSLAPPICPDGETCTGTQPSVTGCVLQTDSGSFTDDGKLYILCGERFDQTTGSGTITTGGIYQQVTIRVGG